MSIENRIRKLEERLTPISPAERQVLIINWVSADRSIDPVSGYSDWHGHTLPREPVEAREAFENRARDWVRKEHPACTPALYLRAMEYSSLTPSSRFHQNQATLRRIGQCSAIAWRCQWLPRLC